MSRSAPALLCELHAHTTWSDGSLSVRELVDLHGRAGFDVLAVTDHVTRPGATVRALHEDTYDRYLRELETEGERALSQYGLVVVPGLELTYDDPDPRLGAHALALGARRFIRLEQGLDRQSTRLNSSHLGISYSVSRLQSKTRQSHYA